MRFIQIMHPLKLTYLFIAFFSVGAQAQNLTQQTFEGTINKTIPIVMTLTQDDTAIFGNVVYKKKGILISVVGRLEGKMLFVNELMPNGSITGTYSVEITNGVGNGLWLSAKKELKLSLKQTQTTTIPRPALGNVTGTYQYSFGKDGGSGLMKVQQLAADKVAVFFDCVTSAPAYNMATVEKTTLKLVGNQAVYSNKEFGNCQFRIKFYGKFAQVDYVDEGYACGFGNAATVIGNYAKTNSNK